MKTDMNKALSIPDFLLEIPADRNPIILQLTDTQIIDASQQRVPDRLCDEQRNYWQPEYKEIRCYQYLREIITAIKPDLIIFSGDVVYGEFDDSGKSFTEFVEFMESFQIPWAPIFGNHDNETIQGVDWQCAQFTAAKHCLFDQKNLSGNGNYSIGIVQNHQLKRVFYMLDTLACGNASAQTRANGHTPCVLGFQPDQMEWYTNQILEIQELSPTTKFSFVYHVQPKIFEKAFAKYGFSDDNFTPIDIDKHPNKQDTDLGYLGAPLKAPWDLNYEVYNSIHALGVDSHFVGHEHANSASVIYNGVRFQFGMKSSTYDRNNYLTKDGDIISSFDPVGKPIVGGTVIPLCKEDGAILTPYIYYCKSEYESV